MEALKASRGSLVLAGLAFALAAAAIWASIALAGGGSGPSGPAPGLPVSGQVAYGDAQAPDGSEEPGAGRDDGDCPEKDGDTGQGGHDGSGSPPPATSSV